MLGGQGVRFGLFAEDKTTRAFQQVQNNVKNTSKEFRGLQAAVRGAITVAAMRQVVNYAETWTNVQNRLKLVARETGNVEKATQRLYDIAQGTRSDLTATVTLYQRLTFATKDLGIEQESIYKFTEQLNKQLKVGGLTSEEAAASVFQLTQAFNKGKLDGDEFRTILESAPPILEALQSSLGKTKGEILDMSKAGALGPQVLIDAVNSMGDITDARFKEMPLTVSDALAKLENSFAKVMGSNGPISGYIENLAHGIDAIISGIDGIGYGLTWVGQKLSGQIDYIEKAKAGGFVTEATFLKPDEAGTEIDKALKEAGLPGFPPPKPNTAENARKGLGKSKQLSAAEKEHNNLLKEKERILDALKTPIDEYNDKMAVAESLLHQGMISTAEFNQYQDKLAEQFDKVGDSAEVNAKIIKDHFADALQSAITDFENFGDAAKGILRGIVDQLVQRNITDPIAGAFGDLIGGSGGGLGGGLFDSVFGGIGDMFGGFFADGGTLAAGKFGVVGDGGEPEIVTAGSSPLTITPMSKLNASSGQNTYYIDARGTDGSVVRRLEQALLALAGPGVVEQRVINAQSRGAI